MLCSPGRTQPAQPQPEEPKKEQSEKGRMCTVSFTGHKARRAGDVPMRGHRDYVLSGGVTRKQVCVEAEGPVRAVLGLTHGAARLILQRLKCLGEPAALGAGRR